MESLCKRPGCAGKIVDGVCEDCGRAPAGASLLAAAASNGSARSAALASGRASAGSGRAGSGVTGSGVTGSGVTGSGVTGSGVTGSGSAATSGSGRTGSSRSGRSSARGARVSTRRQLGAGLVTLPPLPSLDPLLSLMADPVVPDRKRFCAACGAKLGHEKGFCPQCGQEYAFLPTLKAGDVVAGQYEVKGPMAFGGLGWIYLAWDGTLSRWVVLKGLLNSKDAAGAALALAERQFLAAVKHPKIVGVYNFVTRGPEGYIVMEYVGGKTLKAIRQERGPLPAAEAVAYIYAVLPAFAYLEKMGLVYCDFKPDNVMLEEDDVKLIDMGGVRRIDDLDGDIYGTKGYSAPEAAREAPTFVSDLYTVARTLAVLLMDFKFQGTYLNGLPTPAEQPLFAQHDSLYRFLLKGTRPDPDDRFQTAEEMAEDLLGVLREITADAQHPHPAESTLFGPDALQGRDAGDVGVIAAGPSLLPALKLDPLDPAAGAILSAGAVADPIQRAAAFRRAAAQSAESSEAPLRLAWTHAEAGDWATAEREIAGVAERDPYDWRTHWYRGRVLLAQGRAADAAAAFDHVYGELPGELPPKLALALACEMDGDCPRAAHFYDIVSRTDPGYVSAAFGLARCLAAGGDREGAVAALGRVPATSSLYTQAQAALARALLRPAPAPPGAGELARASAALEALTLDGLARHRLAADLLLAAAAQVEAGAVPPDPDRRILGQRLEPVSLRAGAERELRACARYARTPQERIAFVDQANQARPRTLF